MDDDQLEQFEEKSKTSEEKKKKEKKMHSYCGTYGIWEN